MSTADFIRTNSLGDLRAEADDEMLSRAFLETADYRTLIETSDRTVVVGRRGTGKSALTLHLQKHWRREPQTQVVTIAPEEHQTIGLRPQVKLFGDTFSKIRAGSRLAWRYALVMEAASCLSGTYKFAKSDGYLFLESRVRKWKSSGADVLDRYAATLRQVTERDLSPEERIGRLPIALDLTKVERALAEACDSSKVTIVFLIDRLDEGYEPDSQGIGLVDGLVQAAIDLKTKVSAAKPIVFLRDNIFRAVQSLDPDYSRNIEGHVLRLHWDEQALFSFATRRMRIAFDVGQEASQRIWNRCTGGDLKGRDGFNRCLQRTLYRPRDLLSLLNEAFYLAGKSQQAEIVQAHIESSGRTISKNRLDDLKKEYVTILPGLDGFIAAFHGLNPEMTVQDAHSLLDNVVAKGSDDSVVQQEFLILENAQAALRALYCVGFVGVRDPAADTFVFCHDGRAPDREFTAPDGVLVHPCYWMALDCPVSTLEPTEAEEIFDEYDIEISSKTPAIRNTKIRELTAQLTEIELGNDGAAEFEVWCHKAIRICFAKGLRNVELKPNKHAKSRRDIVATNLGEGDAWRRIYEDYSTRQVTFEVKNYQGLKAADYQQVQSYLTGDYGRLGFIITRDDSEDLYAERDVEWVREEYAVHKVLIIKLTGKLLGKLLLKLSNPQKHDAVNDAIHRLLDTYTRLYIGGQPKSRGKQGRRGKRRKRAQGELGSAAQSGKGSI